MPTIDLEQETHDRIHLLARAWDVNETEAVERLVQRFLDGDATTVPAVSEDQVEVPIHAIYKGQRSEGTYDRRTRQINLTEGPAQGTFVAPSPAAAAFVAAVDPSVSANRNGWGFWIVTATGQPLQSIR